MTTIYLVTTGSYSDYRVVGAYSTKDKAEHAKAVFASDFIEEYEVDEATGAPDGLFWYCVTMDREGNGSAERESAEYAHHDQWRPYGEGERICFYMWAEDERHAVKIANERRIMLLATDQWNTDWHSWREAKGASQAAATQTEAEKK